MNKSFTEKVKTSKEVLKVKLEQCAAQCAPSTVRAAKSAFVAHFREKYQDSLKKWVEAFASKSIFSSVQDPNLRVANDKKLERIFNDGKFLSNIDPEVEANEVVINECFVLIEDLLSNEGNLKSDHRYSMLQPSLKYRKALLGHMFTDLESRIKASGEALLRYQTGVSAANPLEKEKLIGLLNAFMGDINSAYEMGVKAGRLVDSADGEEKKKYQGSKLVGFIRKELVSLDERNQYLQYVNTTKERLEKFQTEFVEHAKLRRLGKETPELQYPTPCDLESKPPRGSLQDFKNAKCLAEALFACELEKLPGIHNTYQMFKVWEGHCADLYKGLVQEMATLASKLKHLNYDEVPGVFFRFKAAKMCVDALDTQVGTDYVLSECKSQSHRDSLLTNTQEIVRLFHVHLHNCWKEILSNILSWKLNSVEKIRAATRICEQHIKRVASMWTDEMLGEERIRTTREEFQAECKGRLDDAVKSRTQELRRLIDKLEESNDSGKASGSNGILVVDSDLERERNCQTEMIEALKILSQVLKVDFSEDSKLQYDQLEQRFLQIKKQRDIILERKREVQQFLVINSGNLIQDEKVYEKFLEWIVWGQRWEEGDPAQLEPKFNEIFIAAVVQKLAIEKGTEAVVGRYGAPYEQVIGSVSKLKTSGGLAEVPHRQGMPVTRVMTSKSLTTQMIDDASKSCVTALSRLKPMQIEDVIACRFTPVTAMVKSKREMIRDAFVNLIEERTNGLDKFCKELHSSLEWPPALLKNSGQVVKRTSNSTQQSVHTIQTIKGSMTANDMRFIQMDERTYKIEVKRSAEALNTEVELQKKIKELISTVSQNDCVVEGLLTCEDLLVEAQKKYEEKIQELRSLREAPEKIAEINGRLDAIQKELATCKIEEFSGLTRRFFAEVELVKQSVIPTHRVKLGLCLNDFVRKQEEFVAESVKKINELNKKIADALDLEIKKGGVNFAQVSDWVREIDQIVVTVTQQGLEFPAEFMVQHFETRKKMLLEILTIHTNDIWEVVNVDAGSLRKEDYQENRKTFEKEREFSAHMKIICEKTGLGLVEVYQRYEENLRRAEIAFGDQEQEFNFFETLKRFDSFKYLEFGEMNNEAQLKVYCEIFDELFRILDARLVFQGQSPNPRNLNACFNAFENAIPVLSESDSDLAPDSVMTKAQKQGILDVLNNNLMQYRRRQLDNFEAKIKVAVSEANYSLAEKLIERLSPTDTELAQIWAFMVCCVFGSVEVASGLSNADCLRQNVNSLRSALAKILQCPMKHRLEFYDGILAQFESFPQTRYFIDLHALVLLLRIAEDTKDSSRKGWFWDPEGIKEIATFLKDPLGILSVVILSLDGELVDGEKTPGNWIRSRLRFVDSVVKKQMGTLEGRTEKTVAFFNLTETQCDKFFERDQRIPAEAVRTPICFQRPAASPPRPPVVKKTEEEASTPQGQDGVVVESRSVRRDRNQGLGDFFLEVRGSSESRQVGNSSVSSTKGSAPTGSVARFFNGFYGNNGATEGQVTNQPQADPNAILRTGAEVMGRLFGPPPKPAGSATRRNEFVLSDGTSPAAFINNLYGLNSGGHDTFTPEDPPQPNGYNSDPNK